METKAPQMFDLVRRGEVANANLYLGLRHLRDNLADRRSMVEELRINLARLQLLTPFAITRP